MQVWRRAPYLCRQQRGGPLPTRSGPYLTLTDPEALNAEGGVTIVLTLQRA